MKRFFLFLAAILIVGSAGYFLIARPKGLDLLALVPVDSLAVLDWDSPAGSYQSFLDTPFAGKLQGIDWPVILSALGYNNEEIAGPGKVASRWKLFSESLFFRELFGKRTVVALLPEKDKIRDPVASIGNTLVLLSNSGRKFKKFQSLVAGSPLTKQLQTRNYQGYTVKGYLVKDRYPVYVVTHKDLLIAAFDPAPIRQCLDLLLAMIVRKGGAMVDNPAFSELKQRARGRDDFFLYFDIAAMQPLLRQMSVQKVIGFEYHSDIFDILGHGLRQIGLYHQPMGKVHQVTASILFDKSGLPSFQKHLAGRAPIENENLSAMPADLQIFLWSNWFDLPNWWQATRKNSTGRDLRRVDRLDAAVQKYTGMGMERFLNLFGHQFSLIIKEIKTSGFFPVPRICIRIALADKETMGILLERFIADLPHHRDMVAAVPVVSVLAAGGLMQPSYALLDDDLLFADGRDLIEDILKPGRDFLVRDPVFLKLDMGMQEEENLIAFARTGQLINGLKELASWLGTNIAIRDERAGARSKILIDQAVIPLLDGLTMFRAGALRGYTREDELVLQSRVLMVDE
jgi:hypothetical protein